MLQSEMSIQEVAKDCASFGSTDGSHLLHLCFDHNTEYDPDVVFDNTIFSAFYSMLLFYETYLHSSVDKKRMLEARIKLLSSLF